MSSSSSPFITEVEKVGGTPYWITAKRAEMYNSRDYRTVYQSLTKDKDVGAMEVAYMVRDLEECSRDMEFSSNDRKRILEELACMAVVLVKKYEAEEQRRQECVRRVVKNAKDYCSLMESYRSAMSENPDKRSLDESLMKLMAIMGIEDDEDSSDEEEEDAEVVGERKRKKRK